MRPSRQQPRGVVRRTFWCAAALAVAVAVVPAAASMPRAASPVDAHGERCTAGDRPETGLQGQVPITDQVSGRSQQGYTCNVRLVGSNDIDGRGGDIQLTWSGHCAYRATPGTNGAADGVAVLDVRDPRRPRLVRILHQATWDGRGAPLSIHEGLMANDRRHLLVVPIGTMLSVYDVRECTAPRLVTNFDFGFPAGDPFKSKESGDAGIHSGKLSPDGTLYYATDIGNGAVSPTGPCLTVVDLRNLARPRLVTRWAPDFPCHDLSLSADGTRAFVGYYDSMDGHPAAVVGAFTPVGLSHAVSGLKIVDVSEVQAHRPNPTLRVVSSLTGGRQHTETFARIGGRSYIVAGEEGFCPGGNGRIVDITDERHPVQVAEVPLAVNQTENCALSRVDRDQSDNVLLYMSHYISVDNPDDAHLAFFTWYASGLRVFDIRDPHHPREVGYYNPPVGAGAGVSHDSSTTYSRYLPETGQVWFGAAATGFNVVELAPALRPSYAGLRPSRTWSVAPFPPGPLSAPPALRLPAAARERALTWFCTSGTHH